MREHFGLTDFVDPRVVRLVGFEMCAPFVVGGSEAALDEVARRSVGRLRELVASLR